MSNNHFTEPPCNSKNSCNENLLLLMLPLFQYVRLNIAQYIIYTQKLVWRLEFLWEFLKI